MSKVLDKVEPETITEKKYIKLVKKYIKDKFNTQEKCGDHYGFTTAYIYLFINGIRPVPKSIQKDMGYRREKHVKTTTVYVKELPDCLKEQA